ncbi:hypothetical protein ACFLZK_00365 [Patescibacteria group bacterium]
MAESLFKKNKLLPYLLVILIVVVWIGVIQLRNTVPEIKNMVATELAPTQDYTNPFEETLPNDEVFKEGDGKTIHCPTKSHFEDRGSFYVAFVCEGEDLFVEQLLPSEFEKISNISGAPEEKGYSISIVAVFLSDNRWIMMEIWGIDSRSTEACVYERMGDCNSHFLVWALYIAPNRNPQYELKNA